MYLVVKIRNRRYLISSIICLLAVTMLTFGFAKNQWRVADSEWFEIHQLDTESLVVGRLAKSQQDGILSSGGLTGHGLKYEDHDNVVISQYLIYMNNLPVYEFSTYQSQIGFQAIFFSLLDRLTNFSNYQNLIAFKILTSLLAAIALTMIVLWFIDQFGFFVGIIVLISTLLSQWLVVFGRNLWWVIWAFYIPMLVSIGILLYESKTGRHSNKVSAILLLTAVFIKCLFNGYEYITTILIMMITPYIYYGIYNKWTVWKFAKRILVASIGGIAGTLVSMIILVFQISVIRGELIYGLQHIVYSFGKRAYGNPDQYPAVYKASLEANTFSVVMIYLKGVWFDLNNFLTVSSPILSRFGLKLSFAHLIVLYFLITILGVFLLYKYAENNDDHRNKLQGLIGVTWFSILAPLSWFIIFKGHSYIHTNMNYITWHMPFTLFGFALVGFVIKLLVQTGAAGSTRLKKWLATSP